MENSAPILKPNTKTTSKPSSVFFQPKLTINTPGDQYEQEADAMAEKVMSKSGNVSSSTFFSQSITPIQRKCAHCEEEEKLQRKELNGDNVLQYASTENYIRSLSGKGSKLTNEERKFFEPRFGYNFSKVQLHTNSEANQSAKSVNALAYTHGHDIVFGANQYQSNTIEGKKLLAHELTHVVQQSGASSNLVQKQDDGVEEAAEEMRDRFRADRRRDLGRIIDCTRFQKIRRDCPASSGVRLADVLAHMRTRVAGNPACLRFFRERFRINPYIMFDPSRRPSITMVPTLSVSGRTRCPEPTCDSPIPSVSIGNICNSPLLERVIMHELIHYAHCYGRWGDTGTEEASELGSTICMGTVREALDAARGTGTTTGPVVQPN